MPVKVSVEFTHSNGGVDIRFKANPSGEMKQDEIDMANKLVAILNLLSNEKFQDDIEPWVEPMVTMLHGEQSLNAPSPKQNQYLL